MDLIVDRILHGTQAQITVTFAIDGTGTNPSPDTCSVRVLRADGTELVASTPADDVGAGEFSATLSPADTAALDHLVAEWTATVNDAEQTLRTFHEIVGGFLFSTADAQARPDLAGVSTPALVSGRTLAEQSLEDACGVAFAPRYHLQTFDGRDRRILAPRWRRLTALRSITVDGVPYTSEQLAAVKITESGRIYQDTPWPCGHGNIVIGYEHGYPYPPARVSNAALLLLERWRADQPADERVVSATVDDVSFRLAVAGVSGETFDVPEANAVVAQYGHRAVTLS